MIAQHKRPSITCLHGALALIALIVAFMAGHHVGQVTCVGNRPPRLRLGTHLRGHLRCVLMGLGLCVIGVGTRVDQQRYVLHSRCFEVMYGSYRQGIYLTPPTTNPQHALAQPGL